MFLHDYLLVCETSMVAFNSYCGVKVSQLTSSGLREEVDNVFDKR